MKILHLGDLHYRSAVRYSFDQNLVIEKIIEKLSSSKIDFIFFTGDLVFNGSNQNDFKEAHENFVSKLINGLKVQPDNFFICQGNHDIDRAKCSTAHIYYIDNKIKTNEELNSYYSKGDSEFKNTLSASKNYLDYIRVSFPFSKDDLNPLFTVHKRIYNEKLIGIVTLNSAWLSTGFIERQDSKKLLIPTDVIKQSLSLIKDCKTKILLTHHPLHDLKDFNSLEVEDIIHKEFNLMFSGHLHRERIESRYNGNNGIYCNTTQASLSFNEGDEIGFSIIDFNVEDEMTVILDRSTFQKKSNKFVDLESVKIIIPVGSVKDRQNKLREKIADKFSIELDNANQLLLDYNEENSLTFLESFSEPLFSNQADAEKVSAEESQSIAWENIQKVDQNYLIFGKDKSGKTSLLKSLQLYFITNYSSSGIVPFYIDYKDWEHKTFDFKKALTIYYQINNGDTEDIINSGKIILLIDNLNPNFEIHKKIIDILETNPEFKFVVCSDNNLTRIYFEGFDDLDYKKLFLKDLTRKEIRKYTEKNPLIKNDDKEIALERITHLCKLLHLPINYWIVSLILLIFKKSKDDYNKNLFGILDLCVDEMLSKRKLVTAKRNLKFEQYKELCSQIAHHLLVKHSNNIYSATYEDIIQFIAQYEKNNPRIVGDSREIFEYLFEVGILKKKGALYTFRLNGIFEYFLAFYIKEHEEFRDDILKDNAVYLSFKNELEIYSGFNRKDEKFLRNIFDKTKSTFNEIIDKYYEYGTIDSTLVNKLGEVTKFAETVKRLQVENPLTPEIQDSVRDQMAPLGEDPDVHIKKLENTAIVNFELLEKYLTILARVFKNSDGIQNLDLINEIFNYLLEAYCTLGFKLIDEIEEDIFDHLRGAPDKEDSKAKYDKYVGEELISLIARIVPLLTSSMLYDGVGHANLTKIITGKIDEYKVDVKSNQYKLFLLYFLLMDIDLKGNKNLIDEVFEHVTLPALKVSTLFKLNFYFAFKAHGNKDLENFFRNNAQVAQLRLDNKTDSNDVQSFLAGMHKKGIVKKQVQK